MQFKDMHTATEQTGKGKWIVSFRTLYYWTMTVYKSLNSSIKVKEQKY